MTFQLTRNQANALHYLALALRKDWTHNRPGPKWAEKLGQDWPTLDHADNFLHAVNALVHYATQTADDGTPIKRTPDLYVFDGTHWETTRPKHTESKQPPCEQHPEYGTADTCTACLSEIKAGQRPENMLGKTYHPEYPMGYPTVGQPQNDHGAGWS